MSRLKLKPLEHYSYSTDIPVRISDLNYGRHLGYDRLLSMIHEARFQFLTHHGLSEEDFGGVSLIMGDTAIVYLGEAFAGDILRFEAAAAEPTRCGFRVFFRVSRPADGQEIALVENGLVCFDYRTRSIQPFPETARSILTD